MRIRAALQALRGTSPFPSPPPFFPGAENDHLFSSLFDEIKSRTMLQKRHCYMLYQITQHACTLPGGIVQVGVCQGGSAKLLAHLAQERQKHVYLFDTFSGLPVLTRPEDAGLRERLGPFPETSYDAVQRFLADYHNITIIPGRFPDTAPALPPEPICLADIDVGSYQTTHDCCSLCYPRMTPGGIVMIEDYGVPECHGVRTAVRDFFTDKPERPIYLPTGACMVIRHPYRAAKATT